MQSHESHWWEERLVLTKLEDGGQAGEVEADSKKRVREEKARKRDTENARKKSVDWTVEILSWRLGEEAWN